MISRALPSHKFEQGNPALNSGKFVKILTCLYTTQLTKKRKAWSDGKLRVTFQGSMVSALLLDEDGHREFCGRQLESFEVAKIRGNEEVVLEFEGYLVDVEQQQFPQEQSIIQTGCGSTALSLNRGRNNRSVTQPAGFKVPSKFVPPSKVARKDTISEPIPAEHPPNWPISTPSTNEPTSVLPSTVAGVGGAYTVQVEELDDIWGENDVPLTAKPAACLGGVDCGNPSQDMAAPPVPLLGSSSIGIAPVNSRTETIGPGTDTVVEGAHEMYHPLRMESAVVDNIEYSEVFAARKITDSIWDEE